MGRRGDSDKPGDKIVHLVPGGGKPLPLCPYCAEPEHENRLQCPRILSITEYAHDGTPTDIFFDPEYFDTPEIIFEMDLDLDDEDDDGEDDDPPPAA